MEAFGTCQSITIVQEEGGCELASERVDVSSRLFQEGSGIPQAAVALWQRASCSSSCWNWA